MKDGTEDSESVTLSTMTWMSRESTVVSDVMGNASLEKCIHESQYG
jgi:hypothetical protein